MVQLPTPSVLLHMEGRHGVLPRQVEMERRMVEEINRMFCSNQVVLPSGQTPNASEPRSRHGVGIDRINGNDV